MCPSFQFGAKNGSTASGMETRVLRVSSIENRKAIYIILGFTLEAKLVSSKHLTQVHLKISRSHLRKLGFTPDDKVYYLKHFEPFWSYISQMRLFGTKFHYRVAKEYIATIKRKKRHLHFSRMAYNGIFGEEIAVELWLTEKMYFLLTRPMFNSVVRVRTKT